MENSDLVIQKLAALQMAEMASKANPDNEKFADDLKLAKKEYDALFEKEKTSADKAAADKAAADKAAADKADKKK